MENKLNIGKPIKNWEQLKIELPKKVAARCILFFLEAFKNEGWTDNGFKRWRPRIARGKKENKHSLLVGKGTLRRAVNNSTKLATFDLIRFEVDLPYSEIHNQGFSGKENVRSHTRRAKTKVSVSSRRTGRNTTVKATVGETEVKAFTRTMNMPKRKFMGRSSELNKIIVQLIQTEINKCFL